ncbi:hypothetical protein K488DRAFT_88724, partial [Vararia minispora EC-137]
PAEERYWAERYALQGFAPTLYFYSTPSRRASWSQAHAQHNFKISQPALSLLDTQDPVANWPAAALLLHSADFLPNGLVKTLPGAHWVHMEFPDEVNDILRAWLDQHWPPATAHDEL